MANDKRNLESNNYEQVLSFDNLVELYANALSGDEATIQYLVQESIMAEVVAASTEKGQQFSLAQWDATLPMTKQLLDRAATVARERK